MTKKVIATGVMKHDRFVTVDVPYRDAQQGFALAPSVKGSGLEVKRSSEAGRGCRAPEVTPPDFMLIKSRPYPLYPDEIGPQPR
jgi:hypothetical protein